jgi:hypothetical protein
MKSKGPRTIVLGRGKYILATGNTKGIDDSFCNALFIMQGRQKEPGHQYSEKEAREMAPGAGDLVIRFSKIDSIDVMIDMLGKIKQQFLDRGAEMGKYSDRKHSELFEDRNVDIE